MWSFPTLPLGFLALLGDTKLNMGGSLSGLLVASLPLFLLCCGSLCVPCMVAFLLSPQLLYRSELGDPSGKGPLSAYYQMNDYEVASLLSYTYWKTMPDDRLLTLASEGKLRTKEQLKVEAERMLEDPKAREAFKLFWEGWLNLRKPIGADIPQSLKASFSEEMQRFAEYITFDKRGNLSDLLLSQETFVNFELASHYGLPYSNTGWEKVDLSGDRTGILGKSHFFAVNSSTITSHPIKRGLFVREMLLCQDFPPPPIGAELKPVKDPSLTTREKFEIAHRQDSCLSCHQFVDGVGFGLESYGPTGLFRDYETVPNGQRKPIDSEGSIGSLNSAETILSASEPVYPYSGIRELSELINDSSNGKACFARQFYRYAVGTKVKPDQNCTLGIYGKSFKEGKHSILELLVEFTQTKNFTLRR